MNPRFAQSGDIDALIRLRIEFFSEEPALVLDKELEEIVEKQLRGYFAAHLNKDFFAALAEEDGSIAAVSFLVIHEKPANIRFPTGKTGEILNVYTCPEHRLKGFATAALKLLIKKARDESVSYIELSATGAGKPVYEKLGFTEAPPRHYTEMILNLT